MIKIPNFLCAQSQSGWTPSESGTVVASEVTYQVDAQNYWTISFQLLSYHITHPRSTKVLRLRILLLPSKTQVIHSFPNNSMSRVFSFNASACDTRIKLSIHSQNGHEGTISIWMNCSGFIPSNRLTESVVEQWQGIDPSPRPFLAHQWMWVGWHGNDWDNNCSDQTITLLLLLLVLLEFCSLSINNCCGLDWTGFWIPEITVWHYQGSEGSVSLKRHFSFPSS